MIHASHAPISIRISLPESTIEAGKLLESAHNLGAHAVLLVESPTMCVKPTPLHLVDTKKFAQTIIQYEPEVLEAIQSGVPDRAADAFTDALHKSISECKKTDLQVQPDIDTNIPRWKRIIDMDDEKIFLMR